MKKYHAPLYDAVSAAAARASARFCMPGHSGSGSGLYASAPFDLTEIEGLDNMLCPTGVIREAEDAAARAWGFKRALFFTAGATSAMHTALAAARDRGSVYAVGELHRSFWGGCALLGICPEIYADEEAFFRTDPRGGTAFFTAVDYCGVKYREERLLSFCDAHGVTTVADEAHGAHFAFSELLPQPSRADAVIYGLHKTLPVYTAGALMCLRSDRDADASAFYRQRVHTTSPSYTVMASIDLARARYECEGSAVYRMIKEKVKEAFPSRRAGAFGILQNDDFSRLVLINEGYAASEFVLALTEKGIYPEAAIEDKAVFIVTENNAEKLPLLAAEAEKFVPAQKLVRTERTAREIRTGGMPCIVDADDCAGFASAGEIGTYPPGVPFIKTGEVFTPADAEFIKKNAHMLFGLVNGRVVVLK